MNLLSLFGEKESIRSKELTDQYNEISKNKLSDKTQFVKDLYQLMNDISNYIKEVDQKEKFSKNFCNTLSNVLGDIKGYQEYLGDEAYFSELLKFLVVLLSAKNEYNPKLEKLTPIIEYLDTNTKAIVDPVISAFYSNPSWIPYIEKNNYFPLIVQKLNNESLKTRNDKILNGLADNIKQYSKKKIPTFVDILSKLGDKIPKEIRYSFSNLLYNIFILKDEYFRIFQQKSGVDILLNLFKANNNSSLDGNEAGFSMSDFYCLFLYKEFNKILYEMIIENESNFNAAEDAEEPEVLSEEELIEKYSFKLACLKLLTSIVDQVNPDQFKLTRDQIINIRKVQLMNSTNKSFLSKVDRNPKITNMKKKFVVTYSQLLSQLRSGIWKKDSQKIDKVILEDYWNREDGINYLVNIRNPSFLEYCDQYFVKYENWDAIYDRMEKSDALTSLFLSLFSLPNKDELQNDSTVKYLNRVFDIFESRKELFNKLTKEILKNSFKHFLFVLRNSPNDEIFNSITVLSFDKCYQNYDLSLYSVFLKLSLQFNKKLLEKENFTHMLNIYKVDVENKTPSPIDLAFVALLLLDKNVMTTSSPEIISIASNHISSLPFDGKSCIDRLSFRILQEVDFDEVNVFNVMSVFSPSNKYVPLYMSLTPNSTFFNERFLCSEVSQFDYLTSLNILPRTFIRQVLFDDELAVKKVHPSILTGILRLWPYLHDNHENGNDTSFMMYNKIIPNVLKNYNFSGESVDLSLLILCLFHYNRVLIDPDDYFTLLDILINQVKNDSYKEFWFSLLLSSHQVTTSFLPLPFLEKDAAINTPLYTDNNYEYSVEMASFGDEKLSNQTKLNFSCLVPFSNDIYSVAEESFSNENDFTIHEIKKTTIHPNKEVVDDESATLDFSNWERFVDTLLLISDQVESKQKEEEKQKHENREIIRVSLIQNLIEILFNKNTYKLKVDGNFLRNIFLSNPYEKLSEIEDTLQLFVEMFVQKDEFNQKVFDFILDCAISGWFCERIGAVLNTLFGYFSKFKKKATQKLLLAYKLGFYRITLKEVNIFLCLMKEHEKLFFSIFKKDDYLFYHNRISEFIVKAEEAKKNKLEDVDYNAVVNKCKYTINLINAKYHEIVLRNKPQKRKHKKANDDAKKEEAKDENKEEAKDEDNKEDQNDENKEDAKEENDEEAKEENQNEENKEENNEEHKEEGNEEHKEENNEEHKEENNEEHKEENKEGNEEAKEENNGEANKETSEEPKEPQNEEKDDGANEEPQDEAEEENDEDDKITIEEEEEDTNDPDDDSIENLQFSRGMFSDADEDEFANFKEESYEKKLFDARSNQEKVIKKFRVESKKQFDAKVSTVINFVYKEVKTSELIAENYRKIWFDSNSFDDNLLLRKAEHGLENVFGNRIDVTKSCLTNKELVFQTIEVLTGISSTTRMSVTLNNMKGICFFSKKLIVFVEGLNEEGSFEAAESKLDSSDKNLSKIVSLSNRFEGHLLFEIQRKDVSNLSVNKNTLKFEYSQIKICIVNPSEEEVNFTKILS